MKDGLALEALAGLLEAGRPCRIPVTGVSMLPFLKEGDQLLLAPATPEQLRVGDLIAFRREDRLIVHRFAGWVREDGQAWLRQKGDNCGGHSLVRPVDLVGRVEMVDSARGSRPMRKGWGRWGNGFLGCWAWLLCVGRESLHRVERP